MKVMVFSPVPFSKVLQRIGNANCIGGGWVESILEKMLEIDESLEICVLSVSQQFAVDFVDSRIRYVTTSRQAFVKTLKRVVSDFEPDVIHINGTEFFYASLPIDAYCCVPVVVSLQGLINAYAPHYSGGLTPSELRGTNLNLRFLLRRTSIYGDQKYWRCERSEEEASALRQHRHFIGRTEWDRNWLRYFNSSASYYHVDETMRDRFYKGGRNEATIRKHSIYCGGAASYPLKGVHWLIRAIASLRDEYPDIELRIANCKGRISERRSIGERLRDDAYSIYLRRLICDLGVAEHIVPLPPLTADDVASELMSAELFVLPSLCENSPNSLGEAMLMGTPVVATDVGGVSSMVRNEIDGLLVPSSDPASLAGAIRRCFSDPKAAMERADAARTAAFARHDGNANAEAMLKVFRKVADEKN